MSSAYLHFLKLCLPKSNRTSDSRRIALLYGLKQMSRRFLALTKLKVDQNIFNPWTKSLSMRSACEMGWFGKTNLKAASIWIISKFLEELCQLFWVLQWDKKVFQGREVERWYFCVPTPLSRPEMHHRKRTEIWNEFFFFYILRVLLTYSPFRLSFP